MSLWSVLFKESVYLPLFFSCEAPPVAEDLIEHPMSLRPEELHFRSRRNSQGTTVRMSAMTRPTKRKARASEEDFFRAVPISMLPRPSQYHWSAAFRTNQLFNLAHLSRSLFSSRVSILPTSGRSQQVITDRAARTSPQSETSVVGTSPLAPHEVQVQKIGRVLV